MSNTEPFQIPPIQPGDPVVVAFEPGFSRPHLGWVMVAKKRSCQVLTWDTQGRPLILTDCRHRTDPRLKEQPAWLKENPRQRALFELTESELERRRLAQQVAGLMEIVQEQAKELDAMRKLLTTASSRQNGAPKRRGRPPKNKAKVSEMEKTSE